MKEKLVCILDFKNGNLESIVNALNFLKIPNIVSNKNNDIDKSSHLILPGVGAYNHVMERLNTFIDVELLKENILRKNKPVLGICVGMQIMSDCGFENNLETNGLSLISGKVEKIKTSLNLPHVGWNNIKILKSIPLLKDIDSGTDFYFTHSYCFNLIEEKNKISVTYYSNELTSIVSKNNIVGVQFHPEKSQMSGMKIYKNFFSYYE